MRNDGAMQDSLDLASQPQCADCGVSMRDYPRGYVCPSCGALTDLSEEMTAIQMPRDFDGPSIHGG